MAKKAIYDDVKFFNNYIDLRNKEFNYNDMIEQPIVFDLIGSVQDKTVLDLGCGYGAMTVKLANAGAKKVIGVDVSEKMIEKGIKENPHANVEYRVMAAENLSEINEKYDTVVSCLAIHYINDIYKLFRDVYGILNSRGEFVFSMEHPSYTACKVSQKWVTDPENGLVTGFVMDHYGEEGVRKIEWLGKTITKYHHKTATVINALIEAGFVLEKVVEPSPDKKMMENVPKTVHELHRPAYLIIKCKKG